MTRAQAARALTGARSVREALRRAYSADRHGMPQMHEALLCRAAYLRAVGYPHSRELWARRAVELVAEVAQ